MSMAFEPESVGNHSALSELPPDLYSNQVPERDWPFTFVRVEWSETGEVARWVNDGRLCAGPRSLGSSRSTVASPPDKEDLIADIKVASSPSPIRTTMEPR